MKAIKANLSLLFFCAFISETIINAAPIMKSIPCIATNTAKIISPAVIVANSPLCVYARIKIDFQLINFQHLKNKNIQM